MSTMATTATSLLRSLPDGEVGERSNFIVHIVERFRDRGDVQLVTDGDWSSYQSRPVFRMKPGQRLRGGSIDLGIDEQARTSYEVFQRVREQHGLADVSFQVGIPGDLDLAMFTFGPAQALRQRAAFRSALVREMHLISQWAGRDVVFQIEVPSVLMAVANAPSWLQTKAARIVLSGVRSLVSAAPAGTRFGLHFCLGDLNHTPAQRLRDAAPLVAASRALTQVWPAGRALEYVHLPMAAGEHPPSVDPGFYQPMAKLAEAFPAEVDIIAGFAHERQDLAEQQSVLRMVEATLRRSVAISHACGLGRRDTEGAERALRQAVSLACTTESQSVPDAAA
ncbi:hypothetical protein [Saccharopolyspora griseoalba]|uniref:Methionine synthase n=1 Tax=Saccharopolyspora griseoalba TaxID=1431848 RepID=A0ABW2LWM8_9PSEU